MTALLHRIQVREFGVEVNPTMTFNERGYEVNHLIYGEFGGFEEENPCVVCRWNVCGRKGKRAFGKRCIGSPGRPCKRVGFICLRRDIWNHFKGGSWIIM